MAKFFFICSTSPCLERRLDCQKISDYLIANNWHPVKNSTRADLIIISTCSFGKLEDAASVELVRYYLKRKSNFAKVIIAGCTPTINPDRLNQLGQFSTISPVSLNKLDEIIKAESKFDGIAEPNRISFSEVLYKPLLKGLLLTKSSLRNFTFQTKLKASPIKKYMQEGLNFINSAISLKSRIHPFLVCNRDKFFYIRVSRGCLGNCSYCAKKFATGVLVSSPQEEVVNAFKKGLAADYHMFFLLSEDIGCYGADTGTGVTGLLKTLFQEGGRNNFKIAISNFNARWFIKYYDQLKELFINNKDKILYIQIPVQSGSNRVLQLMNRHYSVEDLNSCLRDLKSAIPSLNITTDMIAGFPGETESDFRDSLDFLKKNKFSYADIFGYEDRPDTLANKMGNKIPQEIIEQRRTGLMRVQSKNSSSKSIFKKIAEVSKCMDHL